VQLTAISWNLFHGRDFPPDPALFTWRSRLLRTSERNASHVQVNRDLAREFAAVLSGAEWDVALLQECPPRWHAALAAACGAEAHGVLTSRNSLAPLRFLAARLNPDLIASGEGGSNLTLVRDGGFGAVRGGSRASVGTFASYGGISHHGTGAPGRPAPESGRGAGGGRAAMAIVERREVTIHAGRPERRAMALTRVAVPAGGGDAGAAELCVANLHASADRPQLAAQDVLRAAAAACEWADDAPLLFGGDLNLRPSGDAAAFEELERRFGLTAPTASDAIDHLLVRGLEVTEAPRLWPAERRELREDGLALRLADHAPVEASFRTPLASPDELGMR
jgi:Endonuclease/Exonuclease/phosphatase family